MKSAFAKIVTETKPTEMKPLKHGISGAHLATYRGGLRAIVKVSKEKLPNGNRKQRGISVSTQPQREVAFYELAKLMGFESLVPETVLTQVEGAVASAQLFLPGAVHLHAMNDKIKKLKGKDGWREEVKRTALQVPKKFWKQLLALDIVAGSRDRHAHNVGITMSLKQDKPTYRLHAWDNACTFGRAFTRYHNVFHKILFRNYVNFDSVWPALDALTLDGLQGALGEYLTPAEIADAYLRCHFFQVYPYRLPWKVCSNGSDSSTGFPPYLSFFAPVIEQPQHLVALSA